MISHYNIKKISLDFIRQIRAIHSYSSLALYFETGSNPSAFK